MIKKIAIFLSSILLLCGFGDCQTSAINASFKVKKTCGSMSDFRDLIKIENAEIQKVEYKSRENFECKKLARYLVTEKFKGNSKRTYDIYTALQSHENECVIVTSSVFVGPGVGDSETLERWTSIFKKR